MSEKAIQDLYPEDTAHCYGCGRLNEHGLHIKSYWHGDHSLASFEPKKLAAGKEDAANNFARGHSGCFSSCTLSG